MILSKPIDAHGVQMTEIKLRKPTVEDINRCGMPFVFDKDQNTIINTKAASEYISRLGNIPPSSVAQLEIADWMGLWGEVMGFFGGAQTT